MAEQTCKTCRHARWQLSEKGNPRWSLPGECGYPVDLEELRQSLIEQLPASVSPPGYLWRMAIWPEMGNCPVWEDKGDGDA